MNDMKMDHEMSSMHRMKIAVCPRAWRVKTIVALCLAAHIATLPSVGSADWFDEIGTGGGSTSGATTTTPASGSAYPTTPSQPSYVQEQRKERGIFAIALTQAAAGSLAGVLSDLIGTLGRKLINWLSAPSPSPSSNRSSEIYSSVSKLSPTEVAAKSLEYPVLGLDKLVLLTSDAPDAQEMPSPSWEKVQGEPMDKWNRHRVNFRTTLKTNDIFSFKFTTSLPGLAKLINVNSRGEITPFPAPYYAMPFGDNRFPPRRGIRMTGQPGTEYLIIEFTPCLPHHMRNDDRVAKFKGQLDICKVEETGQASKGMNRSAKDMTDLFVSSGGSTQDSLPAGVLGSLPGYQSGETLRVVLEIEHVAQ